MVPAIRANGAIMDTGTSLITTSSKDAAAINSVRNHLPIFLLQLGILCVLYTPAHSTTMHTGIHAQLLTLFATVVSYLLLSEGRRDGQAAGKLLIEAPMKDLLCIASCPSDEDL